MQLAGQPNGEASGVIQSLNIVCSSCISDSYHGALHIEKGVESSTWHSVQDEGLDVVLETISVKVDPLFLLVASEAMASNACEVRNPSNEFRGYSDDDVAGMKIS